MPIISGFPSGGNAKFPDGGIVDQALLKTENGEAWGYVKTVAEKMTQSPISFQVSGVEGEELIIEFTQEDGEGSVDGVTSFNGRSGEVIPQAGDYTAEMVGARSDSWFPTTTEIGAVSDTRKINNKPLSEDIMLDANDVGAVPTNRTVNKKALSSDILLEASDVGADPSGSAAKALEDAKTYTDQAIQTAITNMIGGSY